MLLKQGAPILKQAIAHTCALILHNQGPFVHSKPNFRIDFFLQHPQGSYDGPCSK